MNSTRKMIVRNLILIFIFISCSKAKPEQPNPVNLRITKEVVDAFKANDFDKIHFYFSEEMQLHLDAKGIKNVWNSLLIQVGNLVKTDNISAESVGKMQIVWCDLIFDSKTVYLKLAFNEEHLITGMFLLPTKSQ